MIQVLFHSKIIPYTAKLLSGKTFVVVHKIHYSLENFRGASACDHHVLYTASDSRGKLLRSTEKTAKNTKVFPLESVTVYSMLFGSAKIELELASFDLIFQYL